MAARYLCGERRRDGAGVQGDDDRLRVRCARSRSPRCARSGSARPWRRGRSTSRPAGCRRSSRPGRRARQSAPAGRAAAGGATCFSTSAGPMALSGELGGQRRGIERRAGTFPGRAAHLRARRWRRGSGRTGPSARPDGARCSPRRSRRGRPAARQAHDLVAPARRAPRPARRRCRRTRPTTNARAIAVLLSAASARPRLAFRPAKSRRQRPSRTQTRQRSTLRSARRGYTAFLWRIAPYDPAHDTGRASLRTPAGRAAPAAPVRLLLLSRL